MAVPAVQKFAITQTLCPAKCKKAPYDQIQATLPKLKTLLKKDLFVTKYVIVCELTKQANIHYHMYVETTCEFFQQLYSVYTKSLGYSVIKDYKNNGWFDYMYKETAKTLSILNRIFEVKNIKKSLKEKDIIHKYTIELTELQKLFSYYNNINASEANKNCNTQTQEDTTTF